MAKVIKDTPDDPVGYLIKVLKKLYSEGSKVIVISVCSKNLPHVPLRHYSLAGEDLHWCFVSLGPDPTMALAINCLQIFLFSGISYHPQPLVLLNNLSTFHKKSENFVKPHSIIVHFNDKNLIFVQRPGRTGKKLVFLSHRNTLFVIPDTCTCK